MSEAATVWRCRAHAIDLSAPVVMGILNVTPDSFSNQGQHFAPALAIAHAERMIADGAAIIDIGAESTRPGAEPLPLTDELERLMPVLREVVKLGTPVSVDTYKPEVMHAALDAGAAIVNDVNGLRAPGAVEAVAQSGAGVCIMHMQGTPQTMQIAPHYADVVAEVLEFLGKRAQALKSAGVPASAIAIDPGFGFGKTLDHNLALLRATRQFVSTGYPVLIGLSRKGMIGRWTGRPEIPAAERVGGSVAAALLAAQDGAQILRVHDVRDTVQALALWRAVVPRAAA